MRRYNLNREIDQMRYDLARIGELRETLKSAGWIQVVTVFQKKIGKFFQDVYDKCDKPDKHAIEIKCKKMVADALGEILKELDGRVASESFVREQLNNKVRLQSGLVKKQI